MPEKFVRDGVLEEGPGVADFLGIRQLRRANGAYGGGHRLRSRGFESGLAVGFQVLVVDARHPFLREAKHGRENHFAASCRGLEARVAITEVAVGDPVVDEAPVGTKHPNGLDALRHFKPVGTRILHDGAADRARHGGEILEPSDARIEECVDHVVERLARPHFKERVARLIVPREQEAAKPELHDETGNLREKNRVGAAPEDRDGEVFLLREREGFAQLINVLHPHESFRLSLRLKGRRVRQIEVAEYFERHRVSCRV